MVGQLLYSLMPSRSSGAANTLTVSNFGTYWAMTPTSDAEKPHCGKCRVPFMKSTTWFLLKSSSICARVDSLRAMEAWM